MDRRYQLIVVFLLLAVNVMSAMFSGQFAESKTAEVRSCDTTLHDAHMIHNR